MTSLSRLILPSLLLVAAINVADSALADDFDQAALIDTAINTKSRRELSSAFDELFESTTRQEMSRMKLHAHAGIALRAAWEEVLRTIPVHLAEDLDPEPHRKVNRRALHRFVGFVEGRLQVLPPSWWSDSLVRAKAYMRDVSEFPIRQMSKPAGYYESDTGFIMPLSFVAHNLNERGIRVHVIGKNCIIGPEFVKVAKEKRFNSLSTLLTETKCVFGFHSGLATPYSLHCLDRASSKLLWSADVWGGVGGGGGTGAGFVHRVDIQQKDDSLYVFGTSQTGIYIQAFSMKDGHSLFRFAAAY